MKLSKGMFSTVLGVVLAFGASVAYVPDAEARRFGGGGSFGKGTSLFKSPAPTKSTAPSGTSSQQTTKQSSTTNTATGAATTPRRSSFMGPLGGLAAGLGLAALFGYLGFGEGMASFLGTMLMLVIGFFLIRALFRMLAGGAAGGRPALQGQGGNSAHTYRENWQQSNAPRNNDSLFGTTSVQPEVEINPQEPVRQLPEGFDESAFIDSAKRFFVMIQAEFDKGDLNSLREYCSDEVLEFAKQEINERGGQANHTSVVTLEAELVGFETDVDEQLATVAFSALIREEKDAAAQEVHEMWVMSRPVSGGGWVLAGIHNL